MRAWNIVTTLCLCVGVFVNAHAQGSVRPPQRLRPVAKKQALKPASVVPDSPPAPPPTPEQLPAQPARVTYQNGLLTIIAPNSSLGDILNQIHARTGAAIESSGDLNDRVAAQLGPAPPRQVLADLLAGSRFNYVILGAENDPTAIRAVQLIPNNAPAMTPAVAPAQATVAPLPRQPGEEVDEQASPDVEADEEGQQPPPLSQPQPAVPPPHQRGQIAPGQIVQPGQLPQTMTIRPDQNAPPPTPNGEQRVKTPEELLQELQRMQQQQQQQQNQPQQ